MPLKRFTGAGHKTGPDVQGCLNSEEMTIYGDPNRRHHELRPQTLIEATSMNSRILPLRSYVLEHVRDRRHM